jgi:hypothetical protein
MNHETVRALDQIRPWKERGGSVDLLLTVGRTISAVHQPCTRIDIA